VAKCVHHKKGVTRSVAEVVPKISLVSVGQELGSTAMARKLFAVDLIGQKWEGDAAEVRSAAATADNYVRIFTSYGKLFFGLQSNDRLVVDDMVQYRAQRVVRVRVSGRVFNSFGYCQPETSRVIWIKFEGFSP